MTVKTVIATMARGVALAGFLLCLIGGRGAALGGEPSALKGVTLRGLDDERIKLAAPVAWRLHGPDLLLHGMPDLQRLQPDPG